VLRTQTAHRARPPDGSDWSGDHHPRQRHCWRSYHFDHDGASQHHGAGTMSNAHQPLTAEQVRLAAKAGFTLVEMLVVLVIISLVLGLVGPRVLGYLGESRVKTARLQIESFSSALDLFYLDTGRYPTSAEGLNALVQAPSGVQIWNGPYLKGARVPTDPW